MVLSLCIYTPLSAQPGLAKGHWRFEGLPPMGRERLVTSFTSGDVWRPESNATLGDPTLERFWRGNSAILKSTLNYFRVRYGSYEGEPGRSFYLFVRISDQGISLKTSRSGLESPEAGLMLRWGERRIVPLTAAGDDGARIIIGSLPRNETHLDALMFCPRTLGDRRAEEVDGPRPLVESEFRVGAVEPFVSGELAGRVETGFRPGTARGRLLVSEDLPRSIEFQDRLFAVDPEINLKYRPRIVSAGIDSSSDKSELTLAPAPLVRWVSGIRLELDLMNPAGYFRRARREHTIEFQEISLSSEKALKFSASYESLKGRCELFYISTHESLEYGRSDEVRPDWFD